MKYLIPWVIPLILLVGGTAALVAWIHNYQTFQVPMRISGGDKRPQTASPQAAVPIEGILQTSDGRSSPILSAWPGFRGPDLDAVSKEAAPLLDRFPPDGPKELWRLNLGEGYAGAAVKNGNVYLLDYDMQAQRDVIRCLSLDDGREIWNYSYPVAVKRNHGFSRTVPAVTDKYIVTIGPRCHVVCLDARTGEKKWMIDLVNEYGTKEPLWYAGQCPRIEDGRAILAPAGSALMIAVDCETGQVLWQTPNPEKWQMTHSSILPITFAGKRTYVYCHSGGVAGVSAEDGGLLWNTDVWKLRINIPTPVDCGDGRIFLSAGYNKGSMMLRLTEDNGKVIPKVEYELKPEVFGADQQTPIFYNGYIYGVRPNGQLVCMDLNGRILWTSSPESRFALGAYVLADGKLYLLNDHGTLSIIPAVPDGCKLLDRRQVLDGHESWGPPAIAAGRLIIRDLTTMICLDLNR
jgi:outer membrane protein assembly factor BamB